MVASIQKKLHSPEQLKFSDASRRIDQVVRQRLESCSYRYVFDKVTWQCSSGRLQLQGRVPSFYLKQMLQELLRNIDGVKSVDNDVQVVSANGLSSESSGNCPPREPGTFTPAQDRLK